MDTAAQIVRTLLEEWDALLEDRIDDLVAQYAQTKKWGRGVIENMVRYDPSRSKKYLPWIVKQVAIHNLDSAALDRIHDGLMEFERLLTVPAWQGNRDIQSYDFEQLLAAVAAAEQVRSQSEIERQAKAAKKRGPAEKPPTEGIEKVSETDNLKVLRFTDAVSLSWWAWQAYKQENPNWGRPTIGPAPVGADPYALDQKWCIRNPTHGTNYLRKEPFYMVMKDGWPYVGILLDQGQVKDLDNKQVSMGVAEEIYPLLKTVIDQHKADGGRLYSESKIFENMRFLQNGVQAGEKFSDDVDLSNSSLSTMPENLSFLGTLDIDKTMLTELPPGTTVRSHLWARNTQITKLGTGLRVGGRLVLSGSPITTIPNDIGFESLDISNCPVSELPEGLKVNALDIHGTQITKLPDSLVVEKSMIWSEPLTIEECKLLFLRLNMDKLQREFFAHPKFSGLSKVAMEKKWKKTMVDLRQYYLTNPVIEGHVKSIFVYKKPGTISEALDLKARQAAMWHRKTDTIGVGAAHGEAMEDLVRKMRGLGYWNISFEDMEQLSDSQRNRYYRGVAIGFVNAAGKFFTREQSINAGGVTHGEEIK
jgi:hypothetical protein